MSLVTFLRFEGLIANGTLAKTFILIVHVIHVFFEISFRETFVRTYLTGKRSFLPTGFQMVLFGIGFFKTSTTSWTFDTVRFDFFQIFEKVPIFVENFGFFFIGMSLAVTFELIFGAEVY